VLAREETITALWHRLLVRNAAYAREAGLTRVQSEPVQPHLPEDTLLLEYFMAGDELAIFLVTRDDVACRRVPWDPAAFQRRSQLLWLNLAMAARSGAVATPAAVTANALAVLGQLHAELVGPVAEVIAPYRKLVLVPSGPLHYLPFHAFHDGDGYLLERHEISYLPGSSLLGHCQATRPAGRGAAVFGHSFDGRLPHAAAEARAVAAVWRETAMVEQEATLDRLRELAPRRRVVHLAAHGDFRADNPLFSGLALADGALTTLEVFNRLRLDAALVVLSACQTGRHVIGGGDELLGLTRAFLYAGAPSLVLSLWAVEDQSTATLMARMHHLLAAGWAKGAALRQAQLEMLAAPGDAGAGPAAHPFFWAPFILVGDSGPV
jgi:CHAT domain-containing protein